MIFEKTLFKIIFQIVHLISVIRLTCPYPRYPALHTCQRTGKGNDFPDPATFFSVLKGIKKAERTFFRYHFFNRKIIREIDVNFFIVFYKSPGEDLISFREQSSGIKCYHFYIQIVTEYFVSNYLVFNTKACCKYYLAWEDCSELQQVLLNSFAD